MEPLQKKQLRIAAGFNGPPEVANGGYACGICARPLQGAGRPVQSKYRVSIPTEKDFEIAFDDEQTKITDPAGNVLAESKMIDSLPLPAPKPVSLQAAGDASQGFIKPEDHIFADCYVCGPNRAVGEGLRIFAGPTDSQPGFPKIVAAPWQVTPNLATNKEGVVASETIWAALDCPGYFATAHTGSELMLLAGLTVEISDYPKAGSSYIVMGWEIKRKSRSATVGTAIYNEAGNLMAKAEGRWMTPRTK